MSYEPEKSVVEEIAGGRQRVRRVVPGLRWIQRWSGASGVNSTMVLQQRVLVAVVSSGMLIAQSFEWEDVPTEAC